ncbi:MAG: DNA-binding domain-containing protein [Pseudomonadota bacterium]
MTTQTTFTEALLDADKPAPEGLQNPFGGPAAKRFDVYRNNVAVSLTEALETGFPTVRKLVGDDFFKAMAGVFLRAHPPDDPRLQIYGGKLPGFLSRFEHVQHLPYLPDIARLDLGMRQSYHAADTHPLDVTDLPPLEVMDLRPRLAPATLILQSRFPIHGIWRFNQEPDAPKPAARAEDVIITRPQFDPAPHLLPKGGHTFARHLKGKLTLGEAMTTTLGIEADTDVAALLRLFLSTSALTLDDTATHP